MKLLVFSGLLALPFMGVSQTRLLELEVKNFRLASWQEKDNAMPIVNFALEEANTSVSINRSGLSLYLSASNPLDTNWDRSAKGQSLLERELDPMSDLHLIPDPRDFVTAGVRISF